MKFKDYLNENQDDLDGFKENLVKCKPFLKDLYKTDPNIGKFLLSGRRFKTDNIFIENMRKNRRPLDTVQFYHDLFNNFFQKEFGFKARSESLFCMSSRTPLSHIEYYGNAYIIFPIGKYEILWSPKIEDLSEDFWGSMMEIYKNELDRQPDILNMFPTAWYDYEYLSPYKKEGIDAFVDKHLSFKRLGYKTGVLNSKILNSPNEIMLHCDKYLALKYSFWYEKNNNWDLKGIVTDILKK